MKKGVFIAFEGTDGSGKTTQAVMLADKLAESFKVHLTAEPSERPIGKLLRQVLAGTVKMDESVMASLFAADRLDHLLNETDGIRDMIMNGTTVITDRCYISSLAYQGSVVPMEWIYSINAYGMRILKPDMHIFIDIPPETALARILKRKKNADIYETLDYIKRVRDKYHEAFELLRDKETIIIIDGDANAETVAKRIWEAVASRFALPSI